MRADTGSVRLFMNYSIQEDSELPDTADGRLACDILIHIDGIEWLRDHTEYDVSATTGGSRPGHTYLEVVEPRDWENSDVSDEFRGTLDHNLKGTLDCDLQLDSGGQGRLTIGLGPFTVLRK